MSGNFELDIRRFVNHVNDNLDLVTKSIVLSLMRSVILKSPVKTGRFKGNWQYGNNQIPSGIIIDFDPSGTTTLINAANNFPVNSFGMVHYIVNNLPYSIRLENGWSRKAPSGMVGLAISELDGIVRRSVNEVNQ